MKAAKRWLTSLRRSPSCLDHWCMIRVRSGSIANATQHFATLFLQLEREPPELLQLGKASAKPWNNLLCELISLASAIYQPAIGQRGGHAPGAYRWSGAAAASSRRLDHPIGSRHTTYIVSRMPAENEWRFSGVPRSLISGPGWSTAVASL
jgi:hypothetical protein